MPWDSSTPRGGRDSFRTFHVCTGAGKAQSAQNSCAFWVAPSPVRKQRKQCGRMILTLLSSITFSKFGTNFSFSTEHFFFDKTNIKPIRTNITLAWSVFQKYFSHLIEPSSQRKGFQHRCERCTKSFCCTCACSSKNVGTLLVGAQDSKLTADLQTCNDRPRRRTIQTSRFHGLLVH